MPGDASGYRPGAGAVALFHLLVAALALFPLALVDLPALADLPNHLARIDIINRLAGDPLLRQSYRLEWHLMAFQAPDFLLPPLARLVGLAAAARLAVAATFLALLGGTAALHRALFGRVGLWPAATALLFFNFMLAWGLISVLFAIGLMLLLFAAWIATGDRAGLPRTALFALGALAVFLCHFYAFAVYAVLVAAFELAEIRRRSPTLSEAFQRLAHAAATLVVPAALLLTAVNPGAHTITAWGTRDDKIRAILSPLTLYLSRPDYLLIVLVLGLLLLARRRGMFAFAPKMAAPVAAVAILAVAMPSQLASVWGADFRLPTILCLLLVAASELRLPSRRAAVAAGGIMTALLLLRTGFVAHDWLRYQADFDELRAADAAIAPGSRVLAMHDLDDHRDPPAPSLFPYRHVAALAVIDRDVFLPHLFAYATPLRFGPPGKAMESDELAVLRRIRWRPRTPAFGATDAATIGQAEEVGRKVAGFDAFSSTFDWSDWPERFDYLIDFDYGAHANPVPALLTEVARGSYFVIYRIHPPA